MPTNWNDWTDPHGRGGGRGRGGFGTPEDPEDPPPQQPSYPGNPYEHNGDGIGEALADAGDEAFRIRDEEERRGQAAEDLLRNEFSNANRPTMADEDIARMFTTQADAAGRTQLDQEAGLRSAMGANGIQGGGYAQGILTSFENQRIGTVTDARRSLAISKAQSDANDRLNRFKNAQVLAAQVGRDPSVAGSDFLNDAAGIQLGRYAADRQAAAADHAADNTLLGGIIQGGLGLLAGLI